MTYSRVPKSGKVDVKQRNVAVNLTKKPGSKQEKQKNSSVAMSQGKLRISKSGCGVVNNNKDVKY